MYQWYQSASECYAFLYGVSALDHLTDSVWFTRGWTLQELIAPKKIFFYSRTWSLLHSDSNDKDLINRISLKTGIDEDILTRSASLRDIPIATRMSWASHRSTSRREDRAYSLLGIFDVNMPLLYGEGDKAFLRLQQEIIKSSCDKSILAYSSIGGPAFLFAQSPSDFAWSGMVTLERLGQDFDESEISISNVGLSIELVLTPLTAYVSLAHVCMRHFWSRAFPRGICICLNISRRNDGVIMARRTLFNGYALISECRSLSESKSPFHDYDRSQLTRVTIIPRSPVPICFHGLRIFFNEGPVK